MKLVEPKVHKILDSKGNEKSFTLVDKIKVMYKDQENEYAVLTEVTSNYSPLVIMKLEDDNLKPIEEFELKYIKTSYISHQVY
jgi:uncharacterized beta-barrel protein YwiB (DUF1934 family)